MTQVGSPSSPAAAPREDGVLHLLREVTAAHAKLEKIIEDAFDAGPGLPDLVVLSTDISDELDHLRGRVSRKTRASPENVLLPLVCLYDERVLLRVAPLGGSEEWLRVQRRDYAPREDGGDLFFEELAPLVPRAEQLANQPPSDERDRVLLLLTLYRFCLSEGFTGGYAGAPDLLRERTEEVQSALRLLVPPAPRAAPLTIPQPPESWLARLRKALSL